MGRLLPRLLSTDLARPLAWTMPWPLPRAMTRLLSCDLSRLLSRLLSSELARALARDHAWLLARLGSGHAARGHGLRPLSGHLAGLDPRLLSRRLPGLLPSELARALARDHAWLLARLGAGRGASHTGLRLLTGFDPRLLA
ncbi:MAG: hypothetical protein HY910_00695, partial [Desulfarculus sp.]|nr:hypothetical protein [Desulfarculus sp.]